MRKRIGGLAQLARAPALQAGGQRFESVILHTRKSKNKKRSLTYCTGKLKNKARAI